MSTPPPAGAVSPQWQPPPQYQALPPQHSVPLAPNGQPLASFLDRFLAFLIDYVIYFGFSLLWTTPFTIWWMYQFSEFFDKMMNDPAFDSSEPGAELPPPDMSGFFDLYASMFGFILGAMVLAAVYTYIYWVEIQKRWGGQTVGKRVMKIRVIPADPSQEQISRGGYAARWAVQWLAAYVVPFFNLIDGLWQLWDKPLQQCLHDKAAKTVVVKVG